MLKKPAFITLVLTVLLLTGGALSPVRAQEPDYDRINAIATQMNCPTCTGINLADCHTQTCAQWRDQIKDLLAQGMTDEEVLAYFVTQYGTQVLQEPPKSGFTLGLWVLPVIMIGLGAFLLYFALRKMTAAPAPISTGPANAPDDPYLRQVEQDLHLN
jgi:cytochrome c-type biogenesis protein CcmH